MAKLKSWPFHPLLFGVYPVLQLLAANIDESRLSAGLRAFLLSLAASSLVFFLLNLWLKRIGLAALLSSILLISFFSYGHLYTGIKELGEIGILLGRHRFLLPLWLLVTILALYLTWRRRDSLFQGNRLFSLVAVILLVFPLVQIGGFWLRNRDEGLAAATGARLTAATEDLPDIYYIITDAYSRDDLMQSFYNFDNSAFLQQLEDLGFFIAECSLSNYPKTRLSLTSSLNLDYLENLGITANDQSDEFWRRIRRSTVRKTLEEYGYKTVSIQTGFYWTEWEDADVYLSRGGQGISVFGTLNSFEALLLQTTMLRAVFDLQPLLSENFVSAVNLSPRREHYEIVQYQLDSLDRITAIEGPKFVFAHLLIPHGPFVFDAEGNFLAENPDLIDAYVEQVKYTNQRLIEALAQILAESDQPPVIILQGDHGGPGTQEGFDRMKILNAYYLPEGEELLYPSISPVNSFRLVFDTYLGTDYRLIEDLSYYSTSENFFDTTLVTDDRPICQE